MKASVDLKNITVLNKLFYKSAFHGILRQPFFKKKITVYLTILVLFLLYFAYFYFNMQELSRLSSFSENTSVSEVVAEATHKITLLSYFDMTLSISVLLYLFIDNTVSLEKTSLFFAKNLPFRPKEVSLAYRIYKCSVAFVLFQLLMIIETPAIKLITHDSVLFLMIFISQQILFIGLFFIFETFGSVFSRWIFVRKTYELVLLFGALLYLLNYRYTVELAFSRLNTTVPVLIISLSIVSLLVLIASFVLSMKSLLQEEGEYIKPTFYNVKITPPKSVKVFSLSTFRHRSAVNLCILFFIFLCVVRLQQGPGAMMPYALMLSPVLGAILVYYADSTSKIRRMFNLMNFNAFLESLTLILLCLLISTPAFIFSLLLNTNLTTFCLTVCVSVSAILLGFLFPKSEGNLNDSISSLLMMVVLVVLALIFKYELIVVPTMLLEMASLYFAVKKESEKIE